LADGQSLLRRVGLRVEEDRATGDRLDAVPTDGAAAAFDVNRFVLLNQRVAEHALGRRRELADPGAEFRQHLTLELKEKLGARVHAQIADARVVRRPIDFLPCRDSTRAPSGLARSPYMCTMRAARNAMTSNDDTFTLGLRFDGAAHEGPAVERPVPAEERFFWEVDHEGTFVQVDGLLRRNRAGDYELYIGFHTADEPAEASSEDTIVDEQRIPIEINGRPWVWTWSAGSLPRPHFLSVLIWVRR
jgi:hypothetical protein